VDIVNKPSLLERVQSSAGIVRAEVQIRKSQPRRDQTQIWILEIAKCPYCSGRHEHGGGSVEGPPALGFRAPHCFGRVAPGDYELVEVEP
jgi:hypothetical protein